MKFRVTKKSGVSTLYELQVRSIAATSAMITDWPSASQLANSIREEIKNLPRASTGTADNFYQVEVAGSCVHVWHVNNNREPDRLTAKLEPVTQTPTI